MDCSEELAPAHRGKLFGGAPGSGFRQWIVGLWYLPINPIIRHSIPPLFRQAAADDLQQFPDTLKRRGYKTVNLVYLSSRGTLRNNFIRCQYRADPAFTVPFAAAY